MAQNQWHQRWLASWRHGAKRKYESSWQWRKYSAVKWLAAKMAAKLVKAKAINVNVNIGENENGQRRNGNENGGENNLKRNRGNINNEIIQASEYIIWQAA
jgi:hypothetical protein